MKHLYANKRTQNTKLFKEYLSLTDECYKLSLTKENGQQNFFQSHFLINNNGEFINANYSFENSYKKYTKSIEQKAAAIENLAKEKGKKAIFSTFTLNSEFHPFSSIDFKKKRLVVSKNQSFKFKSLEDSIQSGYITLQEIWRNFYQRIERACNKLYYVKVIEFHDTLIPHMHVVLFVDEKDIPTALNRFEKVKKRYNLNQVDFQTLDKKDGKDVNTSIRNATKYLMKYVTKSIKDDAFYIRVIDGLKRKIKARLFTSSNLPLSLTDYRTIYYNLDKDTKEYLLRQAKAKNVCLYYFLLKNTYKAVVTKKNRKSFLKQYGNIQKAQVRLFIHRTALPNGGYKTNNLTFFVNNGFIYKKETYQIIRRH